VNKSKNKGDGNSSVTGNGNNVNQSRTNVQGDGNTVDSSTKITNVGGDYIEKTECPEGTLKDGRCVACGGKGQVLCPEQPACRGSGLVSHNNMCCSQSATSVKLSINHRGVRSCTGENAQRKANDACNKLAREKGAPHGNVSGLNVKHKNKKGSMFDGKRSCKTSGSYTCSFTTFDCNQ